MIDAAIVGLGRWGRNIVNAVQNKSERLRFVRGVVRRPEAARDFAAQHGLALSTGLADALTDPCVQTVALVTPHSQHVEQIIASAGAGKAVFCEKPLALTRADAERAVDALRLEFDAFADAAAGRVPFPVPAAQLIDTVAALEAMNRAMESNAAVVVGRS